MYKQCNDGFYKMWFCFFVEKEHPLDHKGKDLSQKTVV